MSKSKRVRKKAPGFFGTACALGLVATMSACGDGAVGGILSGDEQSKQEDKKLDPSLTPSRASNVGLGLRSADGGFNLAAPSTDDYIIQITACSSGYSTTVASTTASPKSSVPLYTGDGGCLAGLQQFEWLGTTYTKSGGGTLTSGSALFVDGGSAELFVTVGTQLDATISATSEAIFLISEVSGGTDYAISGYSDSAGLTVSLVEAPEVQIPANGITLASINSGSGVATFAVSVQCINMLSPGATMCQTPGASDQLFTDMKAKLVADSYGGTLSYSDASAAMAAGTTSVTAPNLSVAAPITTEGFTISLAGPGQLYTNKNMILIIEYTDTGSGGKSYRYFNVDIGDPQ